MQERGREKGGARLVEEVGERTKGSNKRKAARGREVQKTTFEASF